MKVSGFGAGDDDACGIASPLGSSSWFIYQGCIPLGGVIVEYRSPPVTVTFLGWLGESLEASAVSAVGDHF